MPSNTTHNKICAAIIETFGFQDYKARFAVCESSPRFPVLEAIANHDEATTLENDEWYQRLIRATAMLVNNPKTRAQFK